MTISTIAPRRQGKRVAMLAMADRLFAEYDDLPVRTVLQAIVTSQQTLAHHGHEALTVDRVERCARTYLQHCRASVERTGYERFRNLK